jgi:hypothetical protein
MPEESRAISAEHPTTPKHPFEQARETWEAWSLADTMRTVLGQASAEGDRATLARFALYPGWTQGPGPLDALAANRELVDRLTGWRWLAVRRARQDGHPWAAVGAALGVSAEQARRDFLDRVEHKRQVVERHPNLARLIDYHPRDVALAEPNPADRAHQQRQATERDAGHGR